MTGTHHQLFKTGAATALAVTMTATTALPATAVPVGTVASPVAATISAGDPALASGQAASEVVGEEEQTIPLGGIDPDALPEPSDVGTDPADTPATSAPTTSSSSSASPSDAATESSDAAAEPTAPGDASVAPTESDESAESDGTPQAGAGVPEARYSLMSALGGPTAVRAEKPAGAGDRPSEAAIQDLQLKAEADPMTPGVPAAPEARDLADTVLDEAARTTQSLDPSNIAVLTQPLETIDFIVAGVTWDIADADRVTDVSLRVREGSAWTDWSTMEVHDGDERPGLERVGTEPLVSSGGDAIQVRITTVDGAVPSGLELELIDPGTAETDGTLEPASEASPLLEQIEGEAGVQAQAAGTTELPTAATASAGVDGSPVFVPALHQQQGPLTGTIEADTVATNSDSILKPAIVTRAQWGATESWVKDWGTPSQDLQAMYVHHTAGSNNYSQSTAYAQIRGIYRYHALDLQWGDIGYQFLVDKFGTIYQGRRGSIDQAVQGAQAGGFNTDTIGVSAMGNFDTAAAPAVMVTAIKRVLAWQAYRYDVDPKANVVLTQRGNSATARWSDGRRVTVPTILGHRVTNFTACPGQYLNAQLPGIRNSVDTTVKAAVRQHGNFPSTPPGEVRAEKQQWSRGRLSVWWTRPTGVVDRYEVMRRSAPAGTSDYGGWVTVKWVDAAKYTSGTFDVDPGTTAQFAVRAHNSGGTSELITVASHTRPSVQAPGNVSPSKQQWVNGQLSIWWTRPARVERYEVMRRSAPAGTSDYGAWATVEWLDASKQTSGRFEVEQGTTAQFAVRAHNAGGTSELMTVATHTRVDPVPGRVSAVKKKWVNNKLSIWWTRPAGVERYEVLRRVATAGTTTYGAWQTVKWVDASKYTSGTFDVNRGTTAQFAVRAHNANGHSPLTIVASHTRVEPVPGRVSAVKKKWANNKLSIWWTRPAGVERYEVLRRVATAGTTTYGGWHTVKWVDASKYTSGIFDVNRGITAQFAVRAHNAHGHSPLTIVATHTRPAR